MQRSGHAAREEVAPDSAAFAKNLAQWQVVMEDYYRNSQMQQLHAPGGLPPVYPASSWAAAQVRWLWRPAQLACAK